MNDLSDSGLRVFNFLVALLPTVRPGKPETYITYGDAHAQLGLPGTAQDLEYQGLGDLAIYLAELGLPALTGLVIRKEHWIPGQGYFKIYGRDIDDFAWWEEQIRACKAFDWSPYLSTEIKIENEPPPNDLEVPDRVETTVQRIIRDTVMAKKVKSLHAHACQICGESVKLSGNRLYAEAHHIKPLGSPHNGPDEIGNIICVCPNHHVELDYFACRLDEEKIRTASGHRIDPRYIAYHNDQCAKS